MFKNLLFLSLINYIALVLAIRPLPPIVPMHINLYRIIDGYGSKWPLMVFGLLPIMIVVGMIVYRHKTKHHAVIAQNKQAEDSIVTAVLFLLMLSTWLPVFVAYQYDLPPAVPIALPLESIVAFCVGVFMVAIGNVMGRVKPNRFIGIRVPWTLNNQQVWEKTHRFGAYTGVAGGIVMCACSVAGFMFNKPVISIAGLIGGLVLSALVPIIYSYLIYRNLGDKSSR